MTSSLAQRRASARRARRGYTVVEVMSAMTLFAIGAAGVIGMQRVTIQGGADARNFDTATNIAREWQHRLQRDALAWTEPNSVVTTSNINNTVWLHDSNINNTWMVPAPPTGVTPLAGNSAAFDLLGRDVAPNDGDRIFCVQYRLEWIANNATGANVTGLIRAEIRVFWSRLEFGPPDCANLTVTAPGSREQHHVLNVTTAIRGNPKE